MIATPPAIAVSNLRKSFKNRAGTVEVLRGVSFTVEKGETFALLGPNGSGKTTTLNILSGLLSMDSGEAYLLGQSLGSRKTAAMVSFLSGDSQFQWSYPGRKILNFYLQLAGKSWRDISDLIDRFKLEQILDRTWEEYSNGEKTRIRLTRALLKNPQLIVLDEPTVGLDPNFAEELRKLLKEQHDRGTTILITSHYMRDIEELASRIAFIHNGRIIKTGTLQDYVVPNTNVEVTFRQLPEQAAQFGAVNGNTLVTTLTDLARVVAMGDVLAVHSRDEDLSLIHI